MPHLIVMSGQFHATPALTIGKELSVLNVGARAGLSALEIKPFFIPGDRTLCSFKSVAY
jgi:hypothetical protein